MCSHAIFTPGYDGSMEAIDRDIELLKSDSMKCYTTDDNGHRELPKHPWRLDDERLVCPACERFLEAGLKNEKIPETLQKQYGCAPLGAADGPVKTAIFDGNNARLYTVPASLRAEGQGDKLARCRQLHDRRGAGRAKLAHGYVLRCGWARTVRARLGRRAALACPPGRPRPAPGGTSAGLDPR